MPSLVVAKRQKVLLLTSGLFPEVDKADFGLLAMFSVIILLFSEKGYFWGFQQLLDESHVLMLKVVNVKYLEEPQDSPEVVNKLTLIMGPNQFAGKFPTHDHSGRMYCRKASECQRP